MQRGNMERMNMPEIRRQNVPLPSQKRLLSHDGPFVLTINADAAAQEALAEMVEESGAKILVNRVYGFGPELRVSVREADSIRGEQKIREFLAEKFGIKPAS